MRDTKLYRHQTVRELLALLGKEDPEDTVQYFEVQVRKQHATSHRMSRRVDE